MEKKAKISVEIPGYLKEWVDKHDISQNALVTMGETFNKWNDKSGNGFDLLNWEKGLLHQKQHNAYLQMRI